MMSLPLIQIALFVIAIVISLRYSYEAAKSGISFINVKYLVKLKKRLEDTTKGLAYALAFMDIIIGKIIALAVCAYEVTIAIIAAHFAGNIAAELVSYFTWLL